MSKKIRKMWNKLSDSYILLNSVPLFFQADDTLGGRWWVGRVFERLSLLSPLPPHSCVVVMFLGGCVICSRGGGEKEEEEKVEEEHSFPPILSEFLSAHTQYLFLGPSGLAKDLCCNVSKGRKRCGQVNFLRDISFSVKLF